MKYVKQIISIILTTSILTSGLTLEVNSISIKNFPEGKGFTITAPVKREVKNVLTYTLNSGTPSSNQAHNDDTLNNTDSVSINAEAYKSLTLTEDDIRYIANTVQHEVSGDDDLTGVPENCPSMNVVCAILNRVLDNDFPNTVYGVITQKHQFSGIMPYVNRTDYASENAYNAVRKVLEVGDITNGAEYFLNENVAGHPSWLDNLIFCFKDRSPHWYYKK